MVTLAVDVGGSATRCELWDDELIEAFVEPGRANVTLDPEHAVAHLASIVAAQRADQIVVSVPGAGDPGSRQILLDGLGPLVGVPLLVVPDWVAAYRACLDTTPGTLLIAGTGAVAVTVDDQVSYFGNGGPLFGDDGSSFWIGREAVRLVLRRRELGESGGELGRRLDEALGAETRSLVPRTNSIMSDRHELARLAPVVDAVAAHDEGAAEVLRRAGAALAELVTMSRAARGRHAVAAVGGVFGSSIVVDTLEAAVGPVRRASTSLAGAAVAIDRGDAPRLLLEHTSRSHNI